MFSLPLKLRGQTKKSETREATCALPQPTTKAGGGPAPGRLKMSNRNSCPCPTGVVAVTSTGTTPFLRKSKSARLLLSFALVFGVMLFLNATSAFAQLHGAGILKSCTGPVIVCDTDADCSGAVGDCQQ